jgi:ParB/RepB/Spo0J family partition protein
VPLLPLDRIIPTPDNPRRVVNPVALESMAASIRAQAEAGHPGGVLEPILVRPHPDKAGYYDMRAGFRRWTAAKMAGQTHILAIVRNMTDEEAMLITVVENLEREDLHPLEEAAGIQTLLEKGWDEASIADRLGGGKSGRSAGWVARRVSLLKLIEPFKKWTLNAQHPMNRAPISMLERLARLPADNQKELHRGWAEQIDDDCSSVPYWFDNLEILDREINDRFFRRLKNAGWDLADAVLYPKAGSCLACDKRTAARPLLFGEDQDEAVGKTNDACLDPVCFAEKKHRALEAKVKKSTIEYGRVFLIDNTCSYGKPSPELQKAWGGCVLGANQVHEVAKSDPGAQPAMAIAGTGEGKLTWVQLGALKPEQRHSARPMGTDGKPMPKPLRERRAELLQRRQAYVIDLARAKLHLWAIGKPEPKQKDLAADIATWDLHALLLAFGTAERRDNVNEYGKTAAWSIYENLAKKQTGSNHVVLQLIQSLAHVWENRLTRPDYDKNVGKYYADLVKMNQWLGLDLPAMMVTAEKALPEPKSWASLNPDGTPKTLTSGQTTTRKAGKP